MKTSRRMKRMSRNRRRVAALSLTSLMDVFVTLVFFLVIHQGSSEVLETPKQITLPDSVVEEKPRETVVIFISPDEITVQGEAVARVADIQATGRQNIDAVAHRLSLLTLACLLLSVLNVRQGLVGVLACQTPPGSVLASGARLGRMLLRSRLVLSSSRLGGGGECDRKLVRLPLAAGGIRTRCSTRR